MTHGARDGERRPEGRWQLSPHTGAPAGSSRPLGFQDILAEHDESLSQIKEISSLVPRLFEDQGFGSTEVSGATQQLFFFFLNTHLSTCSEQRMLLAAQPPFPFS